MRSLLRSRGGIFLYGCLLTVLYSRIVIACAPGDRALIIFWLWLLFGGTLSLWVAYFCEGASDGD